MNVDRRILALIALLAVSTVMFWQSNLQDISLREVAAVFHGRHAAPTEPEFLRPVVDLLDPPTGYQTMLISHIPEISLQDTMPHPYVGPCVNCHLIRQGAAAGSQFITPYGALLEKFSKDVVKVGPPIRPDNERMHPPAGRCIKCHDIMVHVPVETSLFRWR